MGSCDLTVEAATAPYLCGWSVALLLVARTSIMFPITSAAFSLCLCLLTLHLSQAMDYGGSGVWDSPMATDSFVKQFGWLFGGGRSGMAGMKAMNNKEMDKKDMKMNNLYDYEIDGKKSLHLFPMPSLKVSRVRGLRRSFTRLRSSEKKMVKLPMMVKEQTAFQPFMAVPRGGKELGSWQSTRVTDN